MTVHSPTREHRVAHLYPLDGRLSPRMQETVAMVATALDFPHAQVNILDDDLLYTVGDHDGGGLHAIDRTDSMCQWTVTGDDVLAIEDLRTDPRSRDLPGVQSGMAASYIGVPLRSRESVVVGTLCCFDSEPRVITEAQLEKIKQFGRIVEDRLDLMRRAKERRLADLDAADALGAAIASGEIVPWFQPIVDLRNDRVVAYEALARWVRPDGTLHSPEQFIPLAEDSDLIVDLDRAVMHRALDELKRWQATRPDLRLNLNLSTRHLEIPDALDYLYRAVIEAEVDPRSVALELTESRELSDLEQARLAVAQLRGHGFSVVLDDFGSGWSSLDWLLGLPIDGMKVDRAVTGALHSRSGAATSRALSSLARDLDLTVTIEGIATRADANLARSHGYQQGQGYYWARPSARPDVDLGRERVRLDG